MLKRTWRDETGLANLTAEIIAKAKAEAAARAKPWKEFGASLSMILIALKPKPSRPQNAATPYRWPDCSLASIGRSLPR
jgi:hypothetical protein